MHGRRLVAYVYDRKLRVERGIEQRHDVVAGKREEMACARRGERACQKVCAAQWRFHEA